MRASLKMRDSTWTSTSRCSTCAISNGSWALLWDTITIRWLRCLTTTAPLRPTSSVQPYSRRWANPLAYSTDGRAMAFTRTRKKLPRTTSSSWRKMATKLISKRATSSLRTSTTTRSSTMPTARLSVIPIPTSTVTSLPISLGRTSRSPSTSITRSATTCSITKGVYWKAATTSTTRPWQWSTAGAMKDRLPRCLAWAMAT